MAESQRNSAPYVVFSGGEIGPETVNRITLENYGATAEVSENYWLDANGPQCIRPGFEFLADMGTSVTRLQSFVRSVDEKFLIALTDQEVRIVSGGDVIARPAVTSTVTTGDFSSLTGWTNISSGAATATIGSGRLLLNSNGIDTAGVRQLVTTSSAGTLHALEIFVHHGPVTLRVGSTSGGDEYIDERKLRTGHHSLAFTPTGSYYVQFTSTLYRQCEVESCQVAAFGDLVLESPWTVDDLQSLRFEQSLNVMYVARGTIRQRRIERWDNNSWSLTETDELDGPFREPNTDESLTLTPSGRVGNGTLTASRSLFKPGHVGSLWRLTQAGQFESRTITAQDQWSDPIQVQGVGGSRAITFTVGTGLTATVRIQRSIGDTTSWADASTSSSTSGGVTIVTSGAGAAQAYNDGLDNNNVYYRVGVKTGEYTSGSGIVTIYYGFASTEGVVRVTNYTNSTSVSIEVLDNLAEAAATDNWEEGAWSDYRGWPRALTVFDGRLWALKDDKFWGSYSEAYESHERDEGASSAIARSVAVGAANTGQWMMPLGRLIIGTEGAEVVVRSNAFDEPLTSTNMTVREMSTYGVGDVQPIKVDTRCIYVDSSSIHMMEIVYNVQIQDYVAKPLTTLHREIGRPGITQLAVSRRPDTRIMGMRGDGQLLTKLFDPGENVLGWGRFISNGASGAIESVAILPGGNANQDEIYIIAKRVIGGVDKRYLERLGPVYYTNEDDARCLDSYVVRDGGPFEWGGGNGLIWGTGNELLWGTTSTTVTNLSHLEGQTVLTWADGGYAGSYTVSGGQITLATAASVVVVGLPYTARYKSSKLAFGAQQGTALAQRNRANKVSLLLRKCARGGVEYGADFDEMDRLPDRDIDDPMDSAPTLKTETTDHLSVPGRLGKDKRFCIRQSAPYPGWIDGFVVGHELNERAN